MKQTVWTIIIVLFTVGLLSFIVWGSRTKQEGSTKSESGQIPSNVPLTVINTDVPIFFYGDTCPHCADVEVWMKENNIEKKIEIIKKEVYENKVNSLELEKAAGACGLPTNSIGVPFLYTPEGECLVGTPDIVGYLSEKAGLSDADTQNEVIKSEEEAEL